MSCHYIHPVHGSVSTFGPEAKRGTIIAGLSVNTTSKTKRWGWREPGDGLGAPQATQWATVLINGDPLEIDKFGQPVFRDSDVVYVCPLDVPALTAEAILAVAALPPLPYSPERN